MTDLMARVEETARSAPERRAVVSDRVSLGYGELAVRARQKAAERIRDERPSVLVADCPAEVAVSLVASSVNGVGLLLLDAAGRPEEHARARNILAAAPPTETPGLVLTTSGTDGPPKCVERPWSAVAANAVAFATALSLRPAEVILCTTPPHHSYAVCGGIVTSLMTGATYVGGRMGPKALAAALDANRVDLLFSVPLLYAWYAGGLPVRRPPRLCVSAGSPLTSQQRMAWEQGPGWRIGQHFGTSEHGMLTLDTQGVPDSVGRPVPGVTVSLVQSHAGCEVIVRTEGAPPRLLLEDGRTELLEGPRSTGDLGAFDADGNLRLLGRTGSVINVAGNKVSAAEVEEAARQYPPVVDCALVGDTSSPGAPRLCLFVEAGENFDRRELMARLTSSLAPYKVPQSVHATTLPRSPAGKVLRSELLRTIRG